MTTMQNNAIVLQLLLNTAVQGKKRRITAVLLLLKGLSFISATLLPSLSLVTSLFLNVF